MRLMKDEDAGLRVRIHLLSSCCCIDLSVGRYLLRSLFSLQNTFHPRFRLLLPLMHNYNFMFLISKRFSPVSSYVHHLHATT